MNKIILITSGIVVLLLIVLGWAYLFMFGTPEKVSDVFANFGLGSGGGQGFEQADSPGVLEDASGPIVASNVLRQVTTRPVAGMVFLDNETARYAEQGTGHIFDIKLQNGAETQISNTTFVKVRDAIFSSDGTKVILSYEEGAVNKNVLGLIQNGTLETASLISGATDFGWDTTGETFSYIVENPNGTSGYTYDVTAKTNTLLFEVPFGSLRALWTPKTILYTKPTASLLGYAYLLTSGKLVSVATGRFGLMAMPYAKGTLLTETANNTQTSTAVGAEKTFELPIVTYPEKCTVSKAEGEDLVCGASQSFRGGALPDDWYKGAVISNDLLWSVNVEKGEATLIVDPLSETGRSLDIEKIISNKESSMFLLMHKTNNTLWLLTPEQ